MKASAEHVLGHRLELEPGSIEAALDPAAFVEAHDTPGGPAPAEVRRAIADARSVLDGHDRRVTDLREALDRARTTLHDRTAQLSDAG